jgi:hypothetical protein
VEIEILEQKLAKNAKEKMNLADAGANWEHLGEVLGISGNALAVELSNAADGVVGAA